MRGLRAWSLYVPCGEASPSTVPCEPGPTCLLRRVERLRVLCVRPFLRGRRAAADAVRALVLPSPESRAGRDRRFERACPAYVERSAIAACAFDVSKEAEGEREDVGVASMGPSPVRVGGASVCDRAANEAHAEKRARLRWPRVDLDDEDARAPVSRAKAVHVDGMPGRQRRGDSRPAMAQHIALHVSPSSRRAPGEYARVT